jgi:hypothetical protein
MKKNKIPFNWLPASWGLRGKSRQVAEAEYYLEGYELDAELARIEHGADTIAYVRAMVEIDQKHGRIDEYATELKLAELDNKDNTGAADLAKLDIDLKYNKISPQEHERKRADLLNEPYMAMPKISWDPADPSKTFFELDYNQPFIDYLRANGYTGTDDDIVNRWLNDVCTSILSEMAPVDPEFVSSVRRVRRDDGTVEHS